MENGMDDIELLQNYAQTNSDEAFGTLVARHIDLVYSAALRRTGNPGSAEEITQAVFIVLAKKAACLGKRDILSSWLFETVRLTSAAFQRAEIRRILREQEAYIQSQSNDPGPDAWTQVAPLLDDAIDHLGDKDRKAIVCRFFEGKSLAQVGQTLGTSEDAAHKRVTRALDKMRAFFVRRGIGISASALAGALTVNSVHAAPIGMVSAVTAAVKGVSTTGSILALSKGTLEIMAWTKIKYSVAVAAALALAAGSSIWVYQDTLGSGQRGFEPAVSTQTSKSSANLASTNGPGFRWENIESTDYRQYIANLRAAGCPEPVIRDIIFADVHGQYNQRAKEIAGANLAVPYWQKSRKTEPTLSQKEKLKALNAEEAAVLRSLLGLGKADISAMLGALWPGVDDCSALVAWLPADKRDAARRRFQEAELSLDDLGNTATFERSVALLKTILTPAELEEYRLRESHQATQLREDSRYADVTPDEFKALVKAREKIKDMQDQSADLRSREIQELTSLLGADRAKELAIKCDRTYVWARLAADRYGLPIESADQALQLKWDTQDATARIQTDTALSETQRRQQLAALRASAEAALVKCLGSDGARIAKNDGEWLRNLTPRP
jgi:RNA polymerase sigma factor (sigma-70 family)